MINYDNKKKTITLSTPNTSYQMKIDEEGRLLHSWYGCRLPVERGGIPDMTEERMPHSDPGCLPDLLSLEYPAPGLADNRIYAVCAEYADGSQAAELRFTGSTSMQDKYTLPALPSFRQGEGAESLCITLQDSAGLQVQLWYGIYEDCDLITRAAVLTNTGSDPLTLCEVSSACLDLPSVPMDLLTIDGVWAGECTPCRAALRPGEQTISSVKGIPGHAHNPAVILCDPKANENYGSCYGMLLVYSGSYAITAQKSEAGIRLKGGIHPYHFVWRLAPGESFTAPEAAFVYSGTGLGQLSRQFHDAIRRHLLPPNWTDASKPRPVLINSWEACYFDFNEEKLLQLASAAKKADIDLFVLDDGWFQGRNDDSTSLGDWVADKEKLPEGLPGLCQKINDLDMDFGLWVEPEAISPQSELYRAHPDWALHIPGRETVPIRHQYTLDFSRAEVVDGIWKMLEEVLSSCHVKYLKWDMNRSLANVYSAALPAGRQGEVYHRYVLGVYELQRRLTEAYPTLLLENCASGGGRFDCGMLYYCPQIWCSDNTDAAARTYIQYGTGLFYPGCVMGAHFSCVPNHCTSHISSVEARMALALQGTFGFELDLTSYSEEELLALRPYIRWYRRHGALLRGGDLYRLLTPDTGEAGSAWMIVSKDQKEAAVFAVGSALRGTTTQRIGDRRPRLRLQGLKEDEYYYVAEGVDEECADEECADKECVDEQCADEKYANKECANEEGAHDIYEMQETAVSGFVLQHKGLALPGDFGQMPGRIWYLYS